MRLVVDNTLPSDLPDLYDGIESGEAGAEAMICVTLVKLAEVAFWVALGVGVGLVI